MGPVDLFKNVLTRCFNRNAQPTALSRKSSRRRKEAVSLSRSSTVPAAVEILEDRTMLTDPEFRTDLLQGVTDQWQTVTLNHTYSSMVVVATGVSNEGDPSVVTRVRNASGNSFQIKLQRTDNLVEPVSPMDVYYITVEEGVYTEESDGISMEAVKYNSSRTDHTYGWLGEQRTYQNSYTAPIVLGQVMSENDEDFSVFWSRGATREDAPSSTDFYAGKHVGEDSDKTRADETIGYIVIEEGAGSVSGLNYTAGLGPDIVEGTGNNPGYTYSVDSDGKPITAVASLAGMDGPDGGWAVFYGEDAFKYSVFSPDSLELAVQEDQLKDNETSHTTEQVAFLMFSEPVEPEIGTGYVENVGDDWVTVNLDHEYQSTVVVATVNVKEGDPPVVARVRETEEDNEFQIKVQRADDSVDPLSGFTVHYVVVEEGVYNEADHGVTMEAVKYDSTVTDSKPSWKGEQRSYLNSYLAPVVVGQVMSDNDEDFSVFWSRGATREDPPSATEFYAGKHVGEDSDRIRADEIIGYIVIEEGSYTVGGVTLSSGLGAATIQGVDNSPGYSYSLDLPYIPLSAVASNAGMKGPDGSWSVLYGDYPLSNDQINLASNEDQLFDTERMHAAEQVAYISFIPNELNSSKAFELNDLKSEYGGDGSQGFIIEGMDLHEELGYSVSDAGDVNGDGIDDFIVGAWQADYNELDNAGKAYVIFGQDGNYPAELDVTELDGTNGFTFVGINSYTNMGKAVSSAGDINGDGFDDLIFASHDGEVYVIFGKATPFEPVIGIPDIDGDNGFSIKGISSIDSLGRSVHSIGDMNGDGYDDIIVSDYRAENYGPENDSGESYVIFGKGTPFSPSLDLNSLDGTNGFIIPGLDPDDRSGWSVSGAGDVNGDGLADIIVGALLAEDGSIDKTGESYVIFGKSETFSTLFNLTTLDGTNGFLIQGGIENGRLGSSVSSAGDINGDGFDDIIIGAWGVGREEDGSQGRAYVIYGKETGFNPVINTDNLDGLNGFALQGINLADSFGWSVSSAGDVNGDGFDDLIIGARDVDNLYQSNGESYLIYGKAEPFEPLLKMTDLNGINGFSISKDSPNGWIGFSVSSTGDINNDGYDDIIIGVPREDSNGVYSSGAAYVIYGRDFRNEHEELV